MVAAATMSLPERAREGRNYDYRYVWIRDQCYAGCAVAKAGAYPLLDDAVALRARAAPRARARPQAGLHARRARAVPDETHLDLPGYPGGSVVVGNWVNEQFQLDVFGEALQLFAAAARHGRLDSDGWRAAELAASRDRQTLAGAGRRDLGARRRTAGHTAGSPPPRACARSAPAPRQGEQAARWLALADTITADTSAHALHPSGRWQRTATDARVDAALLLPGLRGAIPPDDPRTRATLEAVERELTEDGYVYRYRPTSDRSAKPRARS